MTSSAEIPAASPPPNQPEGITIPARMGANILALTIASLLPTGAFGVLAKSNSNLSDKLDTVISRLDRLEAAGIGHLVDDHEVRLRSLEHRLDVIEAKGGK